MWGRSQSYISNKSYLVRDTLLGMIEDVVTLFVNYSAATSLSSAEGSLLLIRSAAHIKATSSSTTSGAGAGRSGGATVGDEARLEEIHVCNELLVRLHVLYSLPVCLANLSQLLVSLLGLSANIAITHQPVT